MQLDRVTAEPIQAVDSYNDDSLADFIKSLTREQAAILWLTRLESHPQLADLL
jgi:ABC-type Mn2+/Zn2+ transport system ATPase subunit